MPKDKYEAMDLVLKWETEGAPTELNPADLPPRDRDISSETEPAKELAPLKDVLPIYDFSWMALQRVE